MQGALIQYWQSRAFVRPCSMCIYAAVQQSLCAEMAVSAEALGTTSDLQCGAMKRTIHCADTLCCAVLCHVMLCCS